MGRLRVDANTINNMRCNFNTQTGIVDTELNPNSNINGTNECSFLDTKVMGVVYPNGTLSDSDEIVGGDIFENDRQPFAKMIDLDVDVQGKSVIYGMKVGFEAKEWNCSIQG